MFLHNAISDEIVVALGLEDIGLFLETSTASILNGKLILSIIFIREIKYMVPPSQFPSWLHFQVLESS